MNDPKALLPLAKLSSTNALIFLKTSRLMRMNFSHSKKPLVNPILTGFIYISAKRNCSPHKHSNITKQAFRLRICLKHFDHLKINCQSFENDITRYGYQLTIGDE